MDSPVSIFIVEGVCLHCKRSYEYTSTTKTPNRNCVDCKRPTKVTRVVKYVKFTKSPFDRTP